MPPLGALPSKPPARRGRLRGPRCAGEGGRIEQPFPHLPPGVRVRDTPPRNVPRGSLRKSGVPVLAHPRGPAAPASRSRGIPALAALEPPPPPTADGGMQPQPPPSSRDGSIDALCSQPEPVPEAWNKGVFPGDGNFPRLKGASTSRGSQPQDASAGRRLRGKGLKRDAGLDGPTAELI